jgi:hypothetical protein
VSEHRKVVDLSRRSGYRPDLAALARHQVSSAREGLGLSHEEFADVLAPLLGWQPSPEAIESWETTAVAPGDVLVAASLATHSATRGPADPSDSDLLGRLVGRQFSDVSAIYPTRSEFMSHTSAQALFDGASSIRIAGLSLNLLCQQYPDQQLRHLVETGTTLRCLFLDPAGQAIKEREREEGHPAGHLSALTQLNLNVLTQRVRGRLSPEAQQRLEIATYDETIRLNIVLIDDDVCVVQPYLPGTRGVDSPTFLIHRRWAAAGLYPMFEQVFNSLWERRQPL